MPRQYRYKTSRTSWSSAMLCSTDSVAMVPPWRSGAQARLFSRFPGGGFELDAGHQEPSKVTGQLIGMLPSTALPATDRPDDDGLTVDSEGAALAGGD